MISFKDVVTVVAIGYTLDKIKEANDPVQIEKKLEALKQKRIDEAELLAYMNSVVGIAEMAAQEKLALEQKAERAAAYSLKREKEKKVGLRSLGIGILFYLVAPLLLYFLFLR